MTHVHSSTTHQHRSNQHQQMIQWLCIAWLWLGLLALLFGGEDALAASVGPWWFWACVPPAVWFVCVRRGVCGVINRRSAAQHQRIQAVRRR